MGDYGTYTCGKPGKVKVKGRWYCGVHDPARKAERRRKKEDGRRATERSAVDPRAARIAALEHAVAEAALAWHGIGENAHPAEVELGVALIALRGEMEDQP
jgi:hypothetical protein